MPATIAANTAAVLATTRFSALRTLARLALLALITAWTGPANANAKTETNRDPQRLIDIRLGHDEGRTRLVIETARPFTFDLDKGDRRIEVVLGGLRRDDILHALPDARSIPGPLLETLELADATPRDSARLVLRFNAPVETDSFHLRPDAPHDHRRVIDFSPSSAGNPTPREAATSKGHRNEAPTRSRTRTPDLGTSTSARTDDAPASDRSAPFPAPAPEELLWVEATLNRLPRPRTLLALRVGDQLFLTGADLVALELNRPEQPDLRSSGEEWFSLAALGIDVEFDPRRMTLALQAPAGAFVARSLAPARAERPTPTPPGRGAFLNYDVSVLGGTDETSLGALLDLGAFGPWGSLTAEAVVNSAADGDGREVVRLDTRWRRDDPANLRTLELGDTVTAAPDWAGNVRFGGLRWGNNFDLHPQLVTTPYLSMDGQAELPSTIELYIDGALRFRDTVDPGPFGIDRIPLVTGSGEARLVVTDLLGREQVLTRSVYASPLQLREGLHDWNVSMGFLRKGYGSSSFDYGPGLISGSHRYGLGNGITSTLHADLTEDRGSAGAGASWALAFGGLVTADGAISRGDNADGWQASLGFQQQGRRFFASVQARWASRRFRRLGGDPDRAPPKRRVFASLNARRILGGTLGLSYTSRDHESAPDVELATLRYSRRVDSLGFLNLAALHDFASGDTALDLRLTIPLSRPRSTLDVALGDSQDATRGSLRYRRSLPVGPGLGYDLRFGVGDDAVHRGSLAWQHDAGRLTLEAARQNEAWSGRVSAAGGLVRMGGETYSSLPLRDSFAVVEVGEFANVRVYADNQEVGRTDRQGRLLVPGLRPYQRNRLRIEQADLPLGANVDGLDHEVVPFRGTGVVAAFPVSRTRDALFRVVLESGEPLPRGSLLHDSNGGRWPIGKDGLAFVSGLAAVNRFHVQGDPATCAFELDAPTSEEPLPDLGTVTCRSEP